MKTSIRLLLTALAISGVTLAAAGTPPATSAATNPPATSLASHNR